MEQTENQVPAQPQQLTPEIALTNLISVARLPEIKYTLTQSEIITASINMLAALVIKDNPDAFKS